MNKLITRVLSILSGILIVGGTLLGYLSKKRMGVQRSLMFRNQKLEEGLLSLRGLSVLTIVATVFFLIVWRQRRLFSSKHKLMWGMSSVSLVMSMVFLKTSSYMGAPWIFLGVYLLYVAVSIKMIMQINK